MLLKIVPLRQLYDAIEWPVVVLIGSLIPIGAALEKSGGTELLANGIEWIVDNEGALAFDVGWIDAMESVPRHRFVAERVRRRQATEMAAFLKGRGRPLIVMGDLNAGWDDAQGVVGYLVDALDLHAREAGDGGDPTFPMDGRRIDWILVSRDLEFVSYQVLPDTLSDHRAVVAEVAVAAP